MVARRIAELYEQRFKLPSTEAPSGSGRLGDVNWEDVSLLGLLGYSVAQGGEPDIERQQRLDRVYLGAVPGIVANLVSAEYLAKWGSPKSGPRLHQMAENIAASVRNAKRRNIPPMQAIRKWEADMSYLKRAYYDGCYDFGYSEFPWPPTDITAGCSRIDSPGLSSRP